MSPRLAIMAAMLMATGCAAPRPMRPPLPFWLPPNELYPPPLPAEAMSSWLEPAKPLTLGWFYFGGGPVSFNLYSTADLCSWQLLLNTENTTATVHMTEQWQFFFVTATNAAGESLKPF